MKAHHAIASGILIFALHLTASQPADELEGCLKPEVESKALRGLGQMGRENISDEQLRRLWPTDPTNLECTPSGCTVVESQDRIIANHCECCTTFLFAADNQKQGKQYLTNVIIHHTTKRRDELVSTARQFMSALGLNGKDLEKVGRDPVQHFGWDEDVQAGGRKVIGVELRFTSRVGLWELYVNVGHFAN